MWTIFTCARDDIFYLYDLMASTEFALVLYHWCFVSLRSPTPRIYVVALPNGSDGILASVAFDESAMVLYCAYQFDRHPHMRCLCTVLSERYFILFSISLPRSSLSVAVRRLCGLT